jgi:hypothetical protein
LGIIKAKMPGGIMRNRVAVRSRAAVPVLFSLLYFGSCLLMFVRYG